MIVGSWGPYIFYVSGNTAKTFNELTQKATGRWAEHETINTVPLSEFLGPGLDEIEMNIIFSKDLGVSPQLNYEALRLAVRKGLYFPMIIGGIPLNGNFWKITEITGTSTMFSPRNGRPTWMECSISCKEYK